MSTLTLKTLEAEKSTEDEAVEVPMKDLAGEVYTNHTGAPVMMRVLGLHSAPVHAAQQANLRRLGKLARGDYTPDIGQENRIRMALAALVGWGMETEDGQPLGVDEKIVRAVLKVAPWLLDQIETAYTEHARFFQSASASS